MRGILLLVVGLAAGLAAGWALFGAEDAVGRAPDRAADGDAPPGAIDRPEPADARAGASAEATRAVRAPDFDEAIVRRVVREEYDKQAKNPKAPEEDLFEAAVREVVGRSVRNRETDARNMGAALLYRERIRAELGEISGSTLVLQVSGHGSVRLTERGNSDRFEVRGPPARGASLTHATGGLVPPGKTFLIERVVLRAHALTRGDFELELPERHGFEWDSADTGRHVIETELKGLVHLRHGYERSVHLKGAGVAASVELHGRLVPDAEGDAIPPAPLLMGDGWLTGEPVLMQVRADHGGGNPRTVHLDGKLYRIDALENASIWEETPDLQRRGSLAYYSGCGRVPAGKAYRVTRIEYRARLDPREKDHSRMTIRVGGRDEVKADASQGGSVSGTWTGDVLILPGRESDVSVTCHYYGLAEITVFGDVVDEPQAKK